LALKIVVPVSVLSFKSTISSKYSINLSAAVFAADNNLIDLFESCKA